MAGQINPRARLAFVVVAMEGEVTREYATWSKEEGIHPVEVKEPAGFLVYFPKGHVLRLRTEAELKHYGLDKQPKLLDMEGIYDPNSPVGQLFMAQSEEERAFNWQSLEDQVIALATAKSGKSVMPEMIATRDNISTDKVRPAERKQQPRKRGRVHEQKELV